MTPMNLDAACAVLGQKLGTIGGYAKDTENSLTKALGVLEEQGVYAMFLSLHARENELGRECSEQLMAFLRSTEVGLVRSDKEDEPFGALQELAGNLDNLLFARELLHQVLVYARYHAKAAEADGGGGSSRASERSRGPRDRGGSPDRPQRRRRREAGR